MRNLSVSHVYNFFILYLKGAKHFIMIYHIPLPAVLLFSSLSQTLVLPLNLLYKSTIWALSLTLYFFLFVCLFLILATKKIKEGFLKNILICLAVPGHSYNLWDLVLQRGIEVRLPVLGGKSLSHWTTTPSLSLR